MDPATRVARVEAGVRWRQVIDAAAPHGLAPLSGSSSGVGVVGYTLGGGMGHLARRHGFAADHVRAIELVTAAGEVITVTAQSDPELFWALRGGQGSFGIVTALEFDLVAVPRFYGGALFFTGADIEPVLRAFGAWATTLPEEVTTSVALLRLPPSDDVPPPLRGTVSLALRFGFAGAPAEGAALLAPMRAVATPVLGLDRADVVRRGRPDPHGSDGADARGHPRDAAHRPARRPPRRAPRRRGAGRRRPAGLVELRLMGGALARPATIPNAVAGRDGAFALTVVAPAPPPLAAVAPVVTSHVVESWRRGRPDRRWSTSSARAAPDSPWAPEVLDRLRRVKAAVDPHDVFGGVVSASALAEVGAR